MLHAVLSSQHVAQESLLPHVPTLVYLSSIHPSHGDNSTGLAV